MLGLVLLASCGVDGLSKKSETSGSESMMISTECGCTFTVNPVCVTATKITYENICHAQCKISDLFDSTPGRCIPDDYFDVCLDGKISTTEKKAFDLIKAKKGTAITKYSHCDKGSY